MEETHLLLCQQVAEKHATSYLTMILEGCAIIVSPLIALMKNQVDLVQATAKRMM